MKKVFVRAVNILLTEKDELMDNAQTVISFLCDSADLERQQTDLRNELEDVVELTKRCVSENARIVQDQDEYNERYNELENRYESVKAEYDRVTQEIEDKEIRKKQLEQFIETIDKQEPITEFDEELWSSLVDYVTVYGYKDIRVTFKDGTEI